ncbi:hypothetical protein D5400_11610 [Georhizobium profundi]|uniref:Flagellar protein FlaF n=1 Tax=Georhizobium profundi TaxID=2341112 RepID=A0A3Q8XNZ5_9HYPH|nr:hypothetical protein [Georhizobium profundi]AZN71835.1 hypothetical protein D5400_11610 [Georhizobium profundi]
MNRPRHIDVDLLRQHARVNVLEALRQGDEKADCKDDRALLEVQRRAIDLQIELQAWMADEFNHMSRTDHRCAVMANMLFSFVMSLEHNAGQEPSDTIAKIYTLMLRALRNGEGHLGIASEIPTVAGGNA